MITLYLLTVLLFFPPNEALCSDLTFLRNSSASVTTFIPSDLEALMEQDKAFSLKLKLATCCLTGDDHEMYDEDTGTAGVQHTVAIAVIKGGGEIRNLAAAPCPPHCDGGKLSTTVADFLALK